MASSNNNTTTFGSDPNTTFVQADPSNFRAVVQKLTGASEHPSLHKLPLTLPSQKPAAAADIGPKRPNFKLHQRRLASANNMDLSIGVAQRPMFNPVNSLPGPGPSPGRNRGFGMGSPVSPLEIMLARGSPRTPAREEEEEEERMILEKGFYLHPSPLSNTDPPQLLPLFPLHSPTSTSSNNNQQQQQPNSSQFLV